MPIDRFYVRPPRSGDPTQAAIFERPGCTWYSQCSAPAAEYICAALNEKHEREQLKETD